VQIYFPYQSETAIQHLIKSEMAKLQTVTELQGIRNQSRPGAIINKWNHLQYNLVQETHFTHFGDEDVVDLVIDKDGLHCRQQTREMV